LRLGDLVDDYCPRERRLTNHAIVALIDQEIRQTRCTTCDAEHVYKGGKVPARKPKKDPTAVLYDQVLANVTGGTPAPPAPPAPPVEAAPAVEVAAAPVAVAEPEVATEATAVALPEPAAPPPVDEGWTLHRTLIRATLPRPDNQTSSPRPIPEFTMHQRNVRGSHMFRNGGVHDDSRNGHGNGHGHGHGRGGFRDDAQPGAPNGQRPGGGRRRRRHKKPRPTT